MEHNLDTLKEINQITLPNSFFLCNSCKSYLFAPIWSSSSGINICNDCDKKKHHFTYVRNTTLESLQANWKYPCAYNQCRFIGSGATAQKHLETCKNFVICPMCSTQESVSKLTDHFTHDHGRSMIFGGPPRFTQIFLDLPQRNPNRVFELGTSGNKWLLISSVVGGGEKIHVVILKCYDARYAVFERIVQDDFVFKWKSRLTHQEFTAIGKTSSYVDYCAGKADRIEIPVVVRERMDLDIHFNNYEKSLQPKTTECPVCFETWTGLNFPGNICQNGHSVCNDCRRNIQQCPLCREPLQECSNPWLSYHLLNQCENKGCIRKMGGLALTKHEDCSHQPRQCPECKEPMALADVVAHLKSAHENFLDGFSASFQKYFTAKGTMSHIYCVYKTYLFRLIINYGKERFTTFRVELMFETDEKLAMRHRYELHFHHASDRCKVISKYKLSNACQLQGGQPNTKIESSLLTGVKAVNNTLNSPTFRFYIFDS